MTPEERLQPAITAVFNAMNSNVPAQPPYNNIKQFLTDHPECLAYARDEIFRLTAPGIRGVLRDTDYESRIRYQALARIIQLYEEVP